MFEIDGHYAINSMFNSYTFFIHKLCIQQLEYIVVCTTQEIDIFTLHINSSIPLIVAEDDSLCAVQYIGNIPT